MSETIEKLLIRHLPDVFGERDPARRATAIEVIFDRDCLFSDPLGRHVGHRELEDTVAALKAQFPDPCLLADRAASRALQNCGRFAWAFGPPHEPRGSPDWTSPS